MGFNSNGQLGKGDTDPTLRPIKIYSTIWGREVLNSKAKSARK